MAQPTNQQQQSNKQTGMTPERRDNSLGRSEQSSGRNQRELARYEPSERWNPFGMWPFGSRLSSLFDDFWSGGLSRTPGEQWFAPALDVSEDEDAYTIQTELPGMRKEDVDVRFEGGELCISGERRFDSEGRRASRVERRYGSFCRTISLPSAANVEAADAEMKDGLLTIRIPKREEAKPKSLKIR